MRGYLLSLCIYIRRGVIARSMPACSQCAASHLPALCFHAPFIRIIYAFTRCITQLPLAYVPCTLAALVAALASHHPSLARCRNGAGSSAAGGASGGGGGAGAAAAAGGDGGAAAAMTGLLSTAGWADVDEDTAAAAAAAARHETLLKTRVAVTVAEDEEGPEESLSSAVMRKVEAEAARKVFWGARKQSTKATGKADAAAAPAAAQPLRMTWREREAARRAGECLLTLT